MLGAAAIQVACGTGAGFSGTLAAGAEAADALQRGPALGVALGGLLAALVLASLALWAAQRLLQGAGAAPEQAA